MILLPKPTKAKEQIKSLILDKSLNLVRKQTTLRDRKEVYVKVQTYTYWLLIGLAPDNGRNQVWDQTKDDMNKL